ncbi:protein MIZU-KUSSEI 1-like [Humulus lupulus]|uniref:protein MIZU-KUSSEI 1-like n=1 Tax=Humulus lupulus TaxID=3486 RepID=UPI002B405612|nr:protein MIZU-KUSSEI 1-like [Humulus lupulus]
MAYPTIGGAANFSSGCVTVVDCHKQVRSWQLLRSLMELIIPCCNINNDNDDDDDLDHHYNHQNQTAKHHQSHHFNYSQPRFSCSSTSSSSSSSSCNVVSGTIFGYRRGKVNLCIQTTSKSNDVPVLLLELAVSTKTLAREMRGGYLRIALESQTSTSAYGPGYKSNYHTALLSTPVWTMYCNGRKAGYAIKRRPGKSDLEALKLMGSVVAGAGVISRKELNKSRNDVVEDDELMYLRANFERVCGSENSESFHLIDPDECIGQELSVFFYRSR